MARATTSENYVYGPNKFHTVVAPSEHNYSPKQGSPLSEPNSFLPTIDQHYHQTESIWRVILDVISLLILTATAIVVHFFADPFTRGFFCSDSSIKYPYKDNTIPAYAAAILSTGLPAVLTLITEICKHVYFSRSSKRIFRVRFELFGKNSARIPPLLRNLYILIVVFGYGYATTWILTDVSKNFVGELRPHFLAVCQPTFNCSAVTLLETYNSYLQFGSDFTCSNTDSDAVKEARRSFFSGHTSVIFYGFSWLIMYIHLSWSWRHLGILSYICQTGLVVLGGYIGYSRISDFHHHWHDVLFGGIVGFLIAFAAFKFVLNWRHNNPKFLPFTAAKNIPPLESDEALLMHSSRRVSPFNDRQTGKRF